MRATLTSFGLLLVAGAGAVAGPAAAQEARPDQVFREQPRTGQVTTVSGSVTENSLENVRVERAGKETRISSPEVVRIVWGDVPPAFRDGQVYASRADRENAVAKFRVAATDASARPVVQAAARLASAEALLAWGATDSTRFAECVTEVDRFLADHPKNRDVPHARWIKARALLLSGDPAGAASGFQALYEEGANEPATTGYRRVDCLRAGLESAEAHLAAGDALAARQLFSALESAFAGLAASAEEASAATRAELLGLQGEAAAGEGWCLLVSGQPAQARSFFEGRLAAAEVLPRERYSAQLGIAESWLAENQERKAQIEFAKVAALDHTDKDRRARALVGLAECTMSLQDTGAAASARRWLTQVIEAYGDTPSAALAAERLETL